MPRSNKENKAQKKFTVLRIVIVSLLLGELLSFISTLPLNLKSLVTILNLNKSKIIEIKKNNELNRKDLNHNIYETNIINKSFESYQKLSIALIIPVFFIIFLYHIPVYRYFRKMKRKKTVSEKHRELAKKRLANSAAFLAIIVFLWYALSYIPYLFFGQNPKNLINFNLTELTNNFVIIKMLSSLLTILFVYLWQNHRVKTHFIQSVFTGEELRTRHHYGPSLKIKRQMIISTLLTTFLPLILIIFYLFTFITYFPVHGSLSPEQMSLFLSSYQEFFNNLGIPYMDFIKNMNSINYFNAVDTFFLFISIFMGVLITLFYLYCITRWTIAEIILPVKELQNLMKDVSIGNYQNFAVVRNNDEIGELSEGYNIMLSFIQKNTSEITKLNQDLVVLNRELEQKVEERTGELQKLNKELQTEVEERIRVEEALLNTNNKLMSRNEIMEGELEMARKIQMRLIPSKSPHPSISFYYKPMDKVGGDYYDFVLFDSGGKQKKVPDYVGIFISDVSGHGVPAAFITSMIKGAVTQGGDILYEPAEFLLYLNDFLIAQTSGNFVTAFYCIYNLQNKELVFSNAGHNHPYIITGNGISMMQAEKSSIPLAIMDSSELYSAKKSYRNEKVTLPDNSKLLLYTDGLVEAVNIKDKYSTDKMEDFETQCIINVMEDIKNETSPVFIKKMAERLIEFRGTNNFDDDVCMVCVDIP